MLINVRALFLKTWVCYKNVRLARIVEALRYASLSLNPYPVNVENMVSS